MINSKLPKKQPALVVKDLSVSTLGREDLVLNKISFGVEAGETLGVVGESGSGKTTLARSIMRQEQPLQIVSGSIQCAGMDLVLTSTKTMRALRGRQIAMVEQDPIAAFDPLFTVGDQIKEFVSTHREAIALAAGVTPDQALNAQLKRLEKFGISEPENAIRYWPHQWSRGMLQRALFSMATAPIPGLLILDEPTAALDTPVADRLVTDVGRLGKESGVATLLITHDLSLAATACDRILVLRDGEIVELNDTATLLSAAQTAYARALIASAAW